MWIVDLIPGIWVLPREKNDSWMENHKHCVLTRATVSFKIFLRDDQEGRGQAWLMGVIKLGIDNNICQRGQGQVRIRYRMDW